MLQSVLYAPPVRLASQAGLAGKAELFHESGLEMRLQNPA
jgi:hypothetical protein